MALAAKACRPRSSGMSSSAPFRHVLVPVDPGHATHRAIAPAVALARMASADIVLMSVDSGDAHHRQALRNALEALEATVSGVPVTAQIVAGASSAAGIVGAAANMPGTVICMASHGPGRLVENFRHTISPEVVRVAPCPVVLVGPQCTDPDPVYTELLVCLDGSAVSDGVVATAGAWAAALALSAWVLEVLEPPAGEIAPAGAETSYVRRRAKIVASHGVSVNWETLHGRDAAAAIVMYAEDHPRAMAVMGSHGHSRREHLTMGSVVMQTTHDAPFPVVVVPAAAAGGGLPAT